MKQSIFKRMCMAAVLAGGSIIYAGTVPAQTAVPVQSAVGRVTEQQVQQWVQGLQQAFPYYRVSLERFRTEGDLAYADVVFSIGDTDRQPVPEGAGMHMRFEVPVEIEHGFVLENNKAGIARIRFQPALSADSSAELLEIFGTQPLYQAQGLVTTGGELDLTFSSIAPFVHELDRSVVWEIPLYSGSFYSYDGMRLGHTEMLMPRMRIYGMGYANDGEVIIENLRVLQHDKPLSDRLYDLNGHTEASIDKIIVRGGDSEPAFVEFYNLHYAEDAKVDASGLYQGQFTVSGRGTARDVRTNLHRANGRPESEVFEYNVTGSLVNLPAEPYVRLLRRMNSGSLYEMDMQALEGDLYDLLQYAPGFSFDEFNLAINGAQGSFKGSVRLDAFVENDRRVEFYLLLLQKLQVNASMNIPVQWMEMFSADQRWLDELVSQGYVTRKGDRLVSSFVYEMGNMTINGQPLR